MCLLYTAPGYYILRDLRMNKIRINLLQLLNRFIMPQIFDVIPVFRYNLLYVNRHMRCDTTHQWNHVVLLVATEAYAVTVQCHSLFSAVSSRLVNFTYSSPPRLITKKFKSWRRTRRLVSRSAS